jgi:hypothetical protein
MKIISQVSKVSKSGLNDDLSLKDFTFSDIGLNFKLTLTKTPFALGFFIEYGIYHLQKFISIIAYSRDAFV